MFLAIKGNINNVYKLHKPDCNTIEQYLKGISHTRFKKQTDAYSWVGIKASHKPLKFQNCVRKLKELGIIPENEVITSCSPIQNIEDDDERNKYYEEREKEKKRKKLAKINKRDSQKDFSKIYSTKEPEHIKRMPGEFKLTVIDMGMQENVRGYFLWYISEGGDKIPFGDFKGKVIQMKKNQGILFKRIFISFSEGNGDEVEGKEDHVWIHDDKEFRKMGIQCGDCVKFNALAYAYKRRNGTIDFGLKAPFNIQYIKNYELPSDDKLKLQSVERLMCEGCVFYENCDGTNCVAETKIRETHINQLLQADDTCSAFVNMIDPFNNDLPT
jgi:hypothetical protein